jgi:hypothetical protein
MVTGIISFKWLSLAQSNRIPDLAQSHRDHIDEGRKSSARRSPLALPYLRGSDPSRALPVAPAVSAAGVFDPLDHRHPRSLTFAGLIRAALTW